MPQCLVRHLLSAHAAGTRSGGALALRTDHVLLTERDGTVALLAYLTLNVPRVGCEEAVVVLEHDGAGPAAADDARWLHGAARRFGARLVRAGAGPAAAVYLRRFAAPGRTLLSSAPGAAAAGALGSIAFAAGSQEAALALAGLPVPFEVPPVIEVRLDDALAAGAEAEDVAAALQERMESSVQGALLEFTGAGVGTLRVDERMTIARLLAAAGARAAVFPVDDRVRAWLRARGRETDWRRLETGGSGCESRVELSLAAVAPRRRPDDDAAALRLRVGPLADDAALRTLARRLKGATLAAGVRLTVVPGGRSQASDGAAGAALAALAESGALVDANAARESDAAAPLLVHGAEPLDGGARAAGIERIAFAALHGRAPRGDELFARDDAADERAGAPLDAGEVLEPAPEAERGAVELEPGAHHHVPPRPAPFAGSWRGAVLARVTGRLDQATLLPWGPRLEALRADAGALADALLGERAPSFAARARAWGGGVLIGGRDAGAGEPAEAAARALAELGVRVVIAESWAPGRRRLFAHHGIAPLSWCRVDDAAVVAEGDVLELAGLPESFAPRETVSLRNLTRGVRHDTDHQLDGDDLDVLAAGGLLRRGALVAASAGD